MNGSVVVAFEVVKTGVALAALISIWIAYKAYRANVGKQEEDRVRDSDKAILAQAEQSLRWAYDVLTNEGANIPPEPNRLNWLTSARHILRHNKLKAGIRSETYITIHDEVEEYWRHRFYLVLSDSRLISSKYYGADGGERIYPKSALVILNFARWKKSSMDPLDAVDQDELIANGDIFKSGAGRSLFDYMQKLNESRRTPQTTGAQSLDSDSAGSP